MINIGNIVNWPRWVKYLLMGAADVAIVLIGTYAAIATAEESFWPAATLAEYLPFLALAVIVTLGVFLSFRLYRHMVRYAGGVILFETVKSVTFAVILTQALGAYLLDRVVPLSVLITLWAYMILGCASIRMLAKGMIASSTVPGQAARQRTAIYGAGDGGLELFNALTDNTLLQVVALFDDDPKLAGRRVHGCQIYPASEIARIVAKKRIHRIILAIPSVSRRRRAEILTELETLGVKVQMLPSVREIIGGQVTIDHLRDVQAADLLWRRRHTPDERLLARDIAGKSVMVTGGGGSIGSELCRQAVMNGARRLAILENTEFALYTIEQELAALIARENLEAEIIPILGDVTNRDLVQHHLGRCQVQTVYHAAAYKHVPLVEFNPCEGVRNNVFGTLAVARAAQAAGVGKFVLVSTDKAVRPTNVMGASKRLAEMVLQALHHEAAPAGGGGVTTHFTMVRFGNVLDSAGSVVPLFRKQIREGGPITLTHSEVTRFFMTIPEAAQLVFQAGAMAQGGEVFLLDMGEPVKIYDLARRMIHLSGLTVADADNPNGDIEIRVTGMRPGEKLHEELFIGENISGTLHPAIMRAEEAFLPWSQLSDDLAALEAATIAGNAARVKALLETLVEGYKPAGHEFVERRSEPRLAVVASHD